MSHQDWKFWERHPRAKAIAAALQNIPAHWSVTPLAGKRPFRKDWQTEPFMPHAVIAGLVLKGQEAVSRKGKTYRRYYSGYGLRLGEASGGLLSIDVDGATAELILQALSNGNIPHTVSWTSGKPGRYQIAFQVPEAFRQALEGFTRVALTEWEGLQTARDSNGKPIEFLEFRYNRSQSVLPPSYHPTTGEYHWINSPVDTEVALAPDWLCELLVSFAEREKQDSQARQQARVERERIIKYATQKRQALGIVGSVDLVDAFNQSVERLKPEEIFNWSGHNFKVKGREWFGCCPQHQSSSGESFTVDPDSLTWHCFGCAIGGGVGEYRHFISGGKGTPKGKDFYRVTKELAEQSGVAMPERTPRTDEGESKNKEIPYVRPVKELPNVGFHIIRKKTDELPFPALETERGQEWLKLREFTPDVVINKQYFDYDFQPNEDLAIKSGTGTGKSYFVNGKWLKDPDVGSVGGGYRNCLNEQFCAKAKELNGRDHYQIQQDLKGSHDIALIADPKSRVIGAMDSWIYFASHYFDEKKIFFDEAESVAKHLNQSNTAVSFYRDIVKQRASDALTNSVANLIADGNLKNFTVEYYEELSGGRKFTKVFNKFTGNKGKVYLYNGSSRKRQATESDVENGLPVKVGDWISFDHKVDDYSKLHRVMMDLPTDIPLLILSDAQKKCEAWDKELSDLGRKVFRLDSTTSTSALGLALLREPKEFILSGKYDTIIFSPSAESGLSIELLDELKRSIAGYFKYEFAYFFGTSTTDTQTQFLARNRDPYTIKFAYVQTHIQRNRLISDANTSVDVFQDWIDIRRECASLSLKGIENDEIWRLAEEKLKAALFDPHARYESKIELMESFEQTYPRLCLEYALREQGWDVILIEGKEDCIEDLRATQAENDWEKSQGVFLVETIQPSEEKKLSPKLNKSTEERHQITKCKLLTNLPGIEEKIIKEEKKINTIEQLQKIEESELIKPIAIGNVPYEEWKANPQPIPEKGLKITIEKPAFDPEFINKVLNKDRSFVHRLEMQFLLKNPDLCKLIQQNKWYKKLDLLTDPDRVTCGGLSVARYKSKLVEVQTLIEMGIGFFITPGNTWHDESPEAIAFWERGKIPRTARNIGMSSEDKPCAYIGKVLKRFGLKTKNKKKSNPDSTRYREYSVDDMDSLSQAVYECVEQRIKTKVSGFDFDWKKILQNSRFEEATTLTEQDFQGVHLHPDNLYKTRVEVDSCERGVATATVVQNTETQAKPDWLINAFAGCDDISGVEFAIDGESEDSIESALLYQEPAHRQQLRQWIEQLRQGCGVEEPQIAERPPLSTYSIGEEVWAYFPDTEQKWLKGVVEKILPRLLYVKSGFFGMHIERPDMIAPGDWVIA